MKKFNLLFVLLSLVTFVSAQDLSQQGTVKMEITDVTSDNQEMAMQLEMMKGSETEVFFKGEKVLTKANMMGGMMVMKNLIDKSADAMNMTIEVMGQKMWIETTLSEMDKDPKQAAVKASTKVTYDKSKTKKIAGYDCYMMQIASPDNPDMTVEGYITESIKGNSSMIQGFQGVEIAGFPLEMTIKNKMFNMTMTAKKISGEIKDSDLTINTDGFKKMTMEELKAMSGGMGF